MSSLQGCILLFFNQQEAGYSLQDLADMSGVDKSDVKRLVLPLACGKYVWYYWF